MLFDHLVRPRQHVGWNRETNLLRRLQIDHQLELRRLLDPQGGWPGPGATIFGLPFTPALVRTLLLV